MSSGPPLAGHSNRKLLWQEASLVAHPGAATIVTGSRPARQPTWSVAEGVLLELEMVIALSVVLLAGAATL